QPARRLRRSHTRLAWQVVALIDLMVRLSYPLDQSSSSGSTSVYSNVAVSVERSAILGVFAWPMTAHTGHYRSKVVMDLLAFSHKGVDSRPASQPAVAP